MEEVENHPPHQVSTEQPEETLAMMIMITRMSEGLIKEEVDGLKGHQGARRRPRLMTTMTMKGPETRN